MTCMERTKQGATVGQYRMVTAGGKRIRTATVVTFPDGYVVKFMDRMPKGLAIRQAIEVRARG